MSKLSNRKKIAAIAAAVVVVGSAGAAYAFWTQGGTGTGSAATGTSSSITVVQTSTVSAMAPGVAPQALSGTFNNPNPGPVTVTTVTATIGTITGGPTCEATDYTLANAVMTVGPQVVASGNAQGTWSGATIAFNNKAGENQDDCKNATVQILYTAV